MWASHESPGFPPQHWLYRVRADPQGFGEPEERLSPGIRTRGRDWAASPWLGHTHSLCWPPQTFGACRDGPAGPWAGPCVPDTQGTAAAL